MFVRIIKQLIIDDVIVNTNKHVNNFDNKLYAFYCGANPRPKKLTQKISKNIFSKQ